MKNKLIDEFQSKRVEPKPRMVGGKFGYAFHKYPIKNGVSWEDLIAKSVEKNNELLERLKKVK